MANLFKLWREEKSVPIPDHIEIPATKHFQTFYVTLLYSLYMSIVYFHEKI